MQLALTAEAFNKSKIPMPVLADDAAGVKTQTMKLWNAHENMDDRVHCPVQYRDCAQVMLAVVSKDNKACHACAMFDSCLADTQKWQLEVYLCVLEDKCSSARSLMNTPSSHQHNITVLMQ